MEIAGTVVSLLPLQTGQGKNGVWKKQEFILETPGQYPKKVCLSLWGEKVDEIKLSIGEKITASINLESRNENKLYNVFHRHSHQGPHHGHGQLFSMKAVLRTALKHNCC